MNTHPCIPHCDNCRFAQPTDNTFRHYECRRHAPSVAGETLEYDRVWPTVGPQDWCGEHEPQRRQEQQP